MVDECSGGGANARRRISAAQKKRSARSMVTRQRRGWVCSFRSRGLVQSGVIENLTLIRGAQKENVKHLHSTMVTAICFVVFLISEHPWQNVLNKQIYIYIYICIFIYLFIHVERLCEIKW